MNAALTWQIQPFGDQALLLVANAAPPEANLRALAVARWLHTHACPGLIGAVPAVNSVLVSFDPRQIERETLAATVRTALEQTAAHSTIHGSHHRITVRYGGADGPDLTEVAAHLGVTAGNVVWLHTQAQQRVLMIGFAPGYPYLGGLPPQLHVPRRATPRTAVPAGSVAIAAGMTGIYPSKLPGGWHLLGRTEVGLFDPHASPPARLAAGDTVAFVADPAGVTAEPLR